MMNRLKLVVEISEDSEIEHAKHGVEHIESN